MNDGSRADRPRLVLADDQASAAALLEQLLQHEFEIVAMVRDGQALVDAATRLSPDAVVTDISMPVLDGIEAARKILESNPAARVVFVTVHADPPLMRKVFAIGGLGYVPKVCAGEELVPAIRAALRGERWCLCSS